MILKKRFQIDQRALIFQFYGFIVLCLIIVSCKCDISKWEGEEIRLVSTKAENDPVNFYGLGINVGDFSIEEGIKNATLKAENNLSQTIKSYGTSFSKWAITEINNKYNKGVYEDLHRYFLSSSDINLMQNNISYEEIGRVNCEGKYYVAILTKTSKEKYFKNHLRDLHYPESDLMKVLFNLDSIFFLKTNRKD